MVPRQQHDFGGAGSGIEGKGSEKQSWKGSVHA